MRKIGYQGRGGIVTGGASGIGLEVARQLVQRGVHVVLVDRDQAALADAVTELGDAAASCPGDVSDLEAMERGDLSYLVNSAGTGVMGFAEDVTPEQWRRVIDSNLIGVLNGIQAVTRSCCASGGVTSPTWPRSRD